MKAADVSTMEFLTRFQAFMSQDDGDEKFYDLVSKEVAEQVKVDFENFDYEPFVELDEEIRGIRRFFVDWSEDQPRHLTVLGMQAGGDWQQPIYMFLYLDDALQWKVYVPNKGNVFNKDTKTAIGDDEDDDRQFMKKLAGTVGLEWADFEDDFEDANTELFHDLMFDPQAMENEMRTDIEIVPVRTVNEILSIQQ